MLLAPIVLRLYMFTLLVCAPSMLSMLFWHGSPLLGKEHAVFFFGHRGDSLVSFLLYLFVSLGGGKGGKLYTHRCCNRDRSCISLRRRHLRGENQLCAGPMLRRSPLDLGAGGKRIGRWDRRGWRLEGMGWWTAGSMVFRFGFDP